MLLDVIFRFHQFHQSKSKNHRYLKKTFTKSLHKKIKNLHKINKIFIKTRSEIPECTIKSAERFSCATIYTALAFLNSKLICIKYPCSVFRQICTIMIKLLHTFSLNHLRQPAKTPPINNKNSKIYGKIKS